MGLEMHIERDRAWRVGTILPAARTVEFIAAAVMFAPQKWEILRSHRSVNYSELCRAQ